MGKILRIKHKFLYFVPLILLCLGYQNCSSQIESITTKKNPSSASTTNPQSTTNTPIPLNSCMGTYKYTLPPSIRKFTIMGDTNNTYYISGDTTPHFSDYCSLLKNAAAGDEYVFQASGIYDSPCSLNLKGTKDHPILIHSEIPNSNARATFTYSQNQYNANPANFFEIGGSYIVFKDFHFAANYADIYIRLMTADHIYIENNIFGDPNLTLYSQSITSNSGNTDHILIRNNQFINANATVIYLGNHNGNPISTDFLFEGNYIDARNINDSSITGYAMEVKLNSYGIVRGNTMIGAQGPDLMIYGNNSSTAPTTIVEDNYLEHSRNDAALNIAGGPSKVFNNVIINSDRYAIYCQNYGGRNIQHEIKILNNTIVSLNGNAINTESWTSAQGNVIAGNAYYSVGFLYPSSSIASLSDNINCSGLNCFSGGNPTISPYQLMPANASPLTASIANNTLYPQFDFYGQNRKSPTPGAISFTPEASSLRLTYTLMRPQRVYDCYDSVWTP